MAVVADQVVDPDHLGPDHEQGDHEQADHEQADRETVQAASDGSAAAPRSVAVVWALVIVAAVVAALLGIKGAELYQVKQDEKRDSQVLDVTRDVVAGLVSLDYKHSTTDLDRIKSVATGTFAQQFDQLAASFEQVLASGQVNSTGSVKEAGIVRADADSAQVLAAVSSVVKNTEAPDGQQRVYRMRVDLEKQGEAWKVGNVEFVS